MKQEPPRSFPVRQRDGQWQVLIGPSPVMWIDTENAGDARAIAEHPVLIYRSSDAGQRSEIVDDLEKCGKALGKYKFGYASRQALAWVEQFRDQSEAA